MEILNRRDPLSGTKPFWLSDSKGYRVRGCAPCGGHPIKCLYCLRCGSHKVQCVCGAICCSRCDDYIMNTVFTKQGNLYAA